MNYIKYTLALIVLSFSLLSSAQVNKDDIDKAIDINSLQHPYLYFSSDELPELRERVANDPRSREIYKELLAEGKRLLYTPVEKDAPVPDRRTTSFRNLG